MDASPAWPPSADVAASSATNASMDDDDILNDDYFKSSPQDPVDAINSFLATDFEQVDVGSSNVPTTSGIDHADLHCPTIVNTSHDEAHRSAVNHMEPSARSPIMFARPFDANIHGPTSNQTVMALNHHGNSSQTLPEVARPRPIAFSPHTPSLGPYHPFQGGTTLPEASYHSHHAMQYFHPGFRSPTSVGSPHAGSDAMELDAPISERDEAEDEFGSNEFADPCYAKLLHRCFKEAPEHTMSLKEIYGWILKHSQKARNSQGKGWMNSVRHNLSMNAAFEKVPSNPGMSKTPLWRLTDAALVGGVISTTRYRKMPKRKAERRASPALQRQLSGAKGGQATRAASAHRRAMQARAAAMHNSLTGGDRRQRGIPPQQQVPQHPFLPTSAPQPYADGPAHQGVTLGPAGHPNQNRSQPTSPYYIPPLTSEPFTMVGPMSTFNPHTPPEMHIGPPVSPACIGSPNPTFSDPTMGHLTEFELQRLDSLQLFGNRDHEIVPDTPSLATERSFYTEAMTPDNGELPDSMVS